jgi:hypothetical protein
VSSRAKLGVFATTALVLAAGVVFVVETDMRPAYDAYGWLVWGKQAWHGNLNTNGAPSWKPLTFLFTFPYALAGNGQMWLWMITAVAGAFAAPVFAARIAYRLTGESEGRPYAPFVAAAFAGLGVLALNGYWHQLGISNSDPLCVALCLAAIDAHLSKRPGLAFAALVLASLGRPEAWLFTAGYAVWAWPRMSSIAARAALVLGLLAIPLLWFGVPALTAKSWFVSGQVALGTNHVLATSQLKGTWEMLIGLYTRPIRVVILAALVIAVLRRQRTWLVLAAAAIGWVLIELAFIYHGWPAEARYVMEPAAVLIALAGAAVGWVLAVRPRWSWRPLSPLVRWAGIALVAVLVLSLVPTARDTVNAARAQIRLGRLKATQMDLLAAAIAADGGAARIRGCGQPTTLVGLQSAVAYELDMNVGYVGHKPGKAIRNHRPIVLLKPHDGGWLVRPIHILSPQRTGCEGLWADYGFVAAVGRAPLRDPDARADRRGAGARAPRQDPRPPTGHHRVRPRMVGKCLQGTWPAGTPSRPRDSRRSRLRSPSSRELADVRWRAGSSRRESSGISRRTPSTTARRKIRRTSRRGSSACASGCARRWSSRPAPARSERLRSGGRPKSATRTRARSRHGRSWARPRPTSRRGNCPQPRRSRRR